MLVRSRSSPVSAGWSSSYLVNRSCRVQQVRFGRRAHLVRHAQQSSELFGVEEGDDFYSILGVPPTATSAQIKKAYYNTMRQFHPDISTDEEDTTDFAVFLNNVYETLSDPVRRAAYDEIAGLSLNAINPFVDKAFELDKVFVDEYTCIGCRNCAAVCPKSFAIEDDYGRARVMAQDVDAAEKLQEAIDTCPVSCIHWVSAPQLTLLEDEMRKFERKDAWLLQNGGGSAANVFLEASNTWQKRQAALRARVLTQQQKSWIWNMWAPSASASSYAAADSSVDDGEQAESMDGQSREDVKRRTAASVASAVRKWRDLKRAQRRRVARKPMLLPAAKDD